MSKQLHQPKAKASLCPICHKAAIQTAHRPFCSARCAEIDLGRWLGESYRIAGEEVVPAAGVAEECDD